MLSPTDSLAPVAESPLVPGEVSFADCWISPRAQQSALATLRSGWVTTGHQVAAFEKEFADTVGARHAVAVSSCTAGLELSLRVLDLSPGSPVLVTTFTFCGAVHAIIRAGLQPVLVDVDPVTGMPTPETVSAAAAGCGGPAAMVALHWAGDPTDVAALADAAGLPESRIVVDAAHAIGTSWRGEPVGGGPLTSFSFYATKNLPIGEGGMITLSEADVADRLRRLRLHGMSTDAWRRYLPGGSWRYDVTEGGLKTNMTDLQAAIGSAQLAHLGEWQQRRAELAAHYDQRLAGTAALALPHRPRPEEGQHAWHLYAVRIQPGAARDRDQVIDHLRSHGVGTSVHFIPVHRLSYFQGTCTVPTTGLPGADLLSEQVLSLPLYPRLTHDQVDHVCDCLLNAIER